MWTRAAQDTPLSTPGSHPIAIVNGRSFRCNLRNSHDIRLVVTFPDGFPFRRLDQLSTTMARRERDVLGPVITVPLVTRRGPCF